METMEAIKTYTKSNEKVKNIETLYESVFPYVAGFVKNMGGDFDDAKDIFHDAMIIYFEIKPELIHSSPTSYLVGIAKHLWIRKHNRSKATVSLTGIEKEISIPEDYFPSVNQKRLLRFLESTGQKCMDLLRAFYYQKVQLKNLLKSFGYSNEHSASVQKYKCLEKVREIVKEKSLAYEDFVE
ncbi:MAG TPA: sigma-70 family RNA polymerase sigma factor [Bacteroidales bacterium]|nr:sigma-70 family RNA polymerase sigma factor [Bacteroidales bacterium]